MNQDEVNQEEWANPANWHAGFLGIYSSERDSRVVVPKRVPILGWTLNMAKPASRIVLGAALVAATVAVIASVRRRG